MKLYTYEISWNQEIRHQIEQDESRHVGYRRVISTMRVVSPSKELADQAAEDRYRYASANPRSVVRLVSTDDLHEIIWVHRMNHYTAQGGLPTPPVRGECMNKVQADSLVEKLRRIQALCTNPHWNAERRWRVNELAEQAERLVEEYRDRDTRAANQQSSGPTGERSEADRTERPRRSDL